MLTIEKIKSNIKEYQDLEWTIEGNMRYLQDQIKEIKAEHEQLGDSKIEALKATTVIKKLVLWDYLKFQKTNLEYYQKNQKEIEEYFADNEEADNGLRQAVHDELLKFLQKSKSLIEKDALEFEKKAKDLLGDVLWMTNQAQIYKILALDQSKILEVLELDEETREKIALMANSNPIIKNLIAKILTRDGEKATEQYLKQLKNSELDKETRGLVATISQLNQIELLKILGLDQKAKDLIAKMPQFNPNVEKLLIEVLNYGSGRQTKEYLEKLEKLGLDKENIDLIATIVGLDIHEYLAVKKILGINKAQIYKILALDQSKVLEILGLDEETREKIALMANSNPNIKNLIAKILTKDGEQKTRGYLSKLEKLKLDKETSSLIATISQLNQIELLKILGLDQKAKDLIAKMPQFNPDVEKLIIEVLNYGKGEQTKEYLEKLEILGLDKENIDLIATIVGLDIREYYAMKKILVINKAEVSKMAKFNQEAKDLIANVLKYGKGEETEKFLEELENSELKQEIRDLIAQISKEEEEIIKEICEEQVNNWMKNAQVCYESCLNKREKTEKIEQELETTKQKGRERIAQFVEETDQLVAKVLEVDKTVKVLIEKVSEFEVEKEATKFLNDLEEILGLDQKTREKIVLMANSNPKVKCLIEKVLKFDQETNKSIATILGVNLEAKKEPIAIRLLICEQIVQRLKRMFLDRKENADKVKPDKQIFRYTKEALEVSIKMKKFQIQILDLKKQEALEVSIKMKNQIQILDLKKQEALNHQQSTENFIRKKNRITIRSWKKKNRISISWKKIELQLEAENYKCQVNAIEEALKPEKFTKEIRAQIKVLLNEGKLSLKEIQEKEIAIVDFQPNTTSNTNTPPLQPQIFDKALVEQLKNTPLNSPITSNQSLQRKTNI